MDKKIIISIAAIITGLICIYLGYNEYELLSADYNPLFTISPDNENKIYFILGVALSVSGFVGLIRERVIENDSAG